MVDVVLWIVYLLLAVVTGLAIWSAVHGVLCHEKTKEPTRGVPSRTIAYIVCGFLVVVCILTFLFGSSQPLLINGEWFKDVFWLKLTDMFIFTALIELAGLVVLFVYQWIRGGYLRKFFDLKVQSGEAERKV